MRLGLNIFERAFQRGKLPGKWKVPALVLIALTTFLFAAAAAPAVAQDNVFGGPAGFVGSAVCAGCHRAEAKSWTASQHAQAMQEATEKAVLGDFNGAQAQHFSSKALFYRKDGRLFVETEGKDGKLAKFAVKYTFGVDPLQQYLVEFPDGRLQALPYAWDTRPKSEGGQRWFHLYPSEDIPPSDPLHWTGPQQNWNYMCAECHSTGVRKNYDAAKDSFHTTFSEVSVGCEACHGPGAGHVGWVQRDRPANVAHSGFQSIPAKGGQMEACGRCHSRRGEFSENWRPGQPLADTHLPVFLTPDLFEDDGQMKDEVFNTSSFQQSKMFAKGVVCTDCHDPHSGKLKAAGSEVCSQCHAPEKFAAVTHTGHSAGQNSPDCIACHMPARTYMVIDRRHDHSFRIPRPDLTVKSGVPNTCSSCHAGRDAGWAAAAVERWHGPLRKGFQTYTEAFYAARLDQPEARDLLLKVAQDASAPAIARATALLQLRERPSAAVDAQIQQGLRDPEPLVRIGALRALEPLQLEIRWARAKASLSDPVRAVRIEAASLLADLPEATAGSEKVALEQGWAEYIAAKQFNADRAEERTDLAGFYLRQGKAGLAEQEYVAAIKLAPKQVPSRVNLADLYRSMGRESEAENLLRETIALQPKAAAAHHALGLALVRQKRYEEAAGSLKRANDLEPAQPRYAYVYAVALQSAQETGEARRVLTQALAANPSNVDILALLLKDALAARDLRSAVYYGERLRKLRPDDIDFGEFAGRLKAAMP